MLLNAFGTNPSLAQTAYRMLVWTVGMTSLALMLLPPRRIAYLLGALVCAALMGWALWLQYGLEPRSVPAVHLPAHRRHRDRRRVPDRGDPQSRGALARRSTRS